MFTKNFKNKNKNGEKFSSLQCLLKNLSNLVQEDLQKPIKIRPLFLNSFNNFSTTKVIWTEEFKVSQQVRKMSQYLLQNILKAKLDDYDAIKGDKYSNDKEKLRSKSDLNQRQTNFNFYSDFQARTFQTDLDTIDSVQKFNTNFLKYDDNQEGSDIGRINKYQKVDFSELKQVNFDTLTEEQQQNMLSFLAQDQLKNGHLDQQNSQQKELENGKKESKKQTQLQNSDVNFLDF